MFVTPPKESMGKRPKRIQELMFEFSKVQYDFINAISVELEKDEFTELNEFEKTEFDNSFQLQAEAYEAIQNLIESY